jgi:predicted dehydrogenase
MIEVCRSAGVKLAIGHQYRFHPYFIRAAEMRRARALGKIVEVRGNIKDSVANNVPHLLDTIRFVMGRPAERRIAATFERKSNKENRGLAGRGRGPRRAHVRRRRRCKGRVGRFLAHVLRDRGRRRQGIAHGRPGSE